MRLAILADIHGNREALENVLSDIDRSDVDGMVCLGDTIGYGPEPNQAISMVRERNIPRVIGNHELAVLEPVHLNGFNDYTRESLKKTAQWLTEETLGFIRTLKPSIAAYDCRFVHGFPPASPSIYLSHVSLVTLLRVFQQMEETLCSVGHTHRLEFIDYDGQQINRSFLSQGKRRLCKSNRYIVNTGSVGQLRDGNNRVKYVIFDTGAYTIDLRFVPYDTIVASGKIIAAGLPEIYARKLL